MIEHDLDKNNAVLHVRPKGALRKEDFDQLAQAVDPFIAEQGALTGLIIETSGFPGWENFGAMLRHFRFVRDHHRKIKRVALVTDSPLGELAEHLASHFVAAEVRHFRAKEGEAAKAWIAEAAPG